MLFPLELLGGKQQKLFDHCYLASKSKKGIHWKEIWEPPEFMGRLQNGA